MTDQPYILNGSRVRDIREGCSMSRADLAEAMGLARSSATWVGLIESERHLPMKKTARKIAEALGVFLEDITRHGPTVRAWVEPAMPAGRGGGVQARPLIERLSEKTSVDTAGCWIWQGRINGAGYGEIKVPGGRRLKAHRATYECHVGPIPEGLDLDHLCRVPLCVNPEHLEPVTRRENIRRSYDARGFARREAA